MRWYISVATAAALSVASLVAAAPANAATVVSSFTAPPGPYNLGNPHGTIAPATVHLPNTYDWTFSTTGVFNVLVQLHASYIPQPLAFTLFSGLPGSGSLVASSGALQMDPAIARVLNAGNYYVEVTPADLVRREELITGFLDVTAAVPEPAEWALIMVGAGLIGLAARRRRALAAI